MQLILPDIMADARGMSMAVYATGLGLGCLLWLSGWWGHRFWIVLFTTVTAGIAGLASGRATGMQPFVAGLLLAVAAGVMALALARLLAFAAAGAAAWLLVRSLAPGWDEPLLSFLTGGLLGLLLFRAWTMALSSLAGTLLMVYSGLGLADRLNKLDALLWAEKRAMLLNCIVLGVALFGFAVQFVMERVRVQREKQLRDKEELDRAKKELEQRFKRRAAGHWWPWGTPNPAAGAPKKVA
jgi:MFS family permease